MDFLFVFINYSFGLALTFVFIEDVECNRKNQKNDLDEIISDDLENNLLSEESDVLIIQ